MPEIRERMPKRDLPSGAIAGTRVVRGWRILDGRGDDALGALFAELRRRDWYDSATIALVDCSGCHWCVSLSSTPMRAGSSSAAIFTCSERSGQAG